MERNRKQKLLMIIALVLGITSLSIGFAAFSTTLNISSSASVSPNSDTFSVKFSTSQNSLVVGAVTPSSKTSGITATNGVINNSFNPMISNLSAQFTAPGQYVEYTFYARNEGEYTAYLNNINYIGEKKCTPGTGTTASLVEAACNSITMTVTVSGKEYNVTTGITGHALAKKNGEEVKVKLSYETNGELADGEFTVAFGDVTLVYSSIDDSTFVPPITGGGVNGTTLVSIMSKDAVSDSSVDFSSSTGLDVENNIAYVVNGTENNQYPIYYYRGNVTKNNVIFANFCWKIVRTTETGGTKLVYSGVPSADGQCNDMDEERSIGTSAFNTSYDSIDDLRYIYADGKDSTIKAYIDDWYEANMTTYTSKLEDTVWCNDRSVYKAEAGYVFFGAWGRLNNSPYKPSLECGAESQMTVSLTDVDKHLKYPVALLTADEIFFAGINFTSYLYTGAGMWSLTPSHSLFDSFYGFRIMDDGLDTENPDLPLCVHPTISLKPGTTITGTGDGSVSSPYVIE